jgi:hypothetical protein
MRELALSKVYQLLEPGPAVLLATAHHDRANVMTMSWHMMVEFEPPLVACVVSKHRGGRGVSPGAARNGIDCFEERDLEFRTFAVRTNPGTKGHDKARKHRESPQGSPF